MDHERLAWLGIAELTADALVLSGTWVGVVYGRAWLPQLWPLDLFEADVLQAVSPSVHLPLLALVLPVWLLALASRGRYRRRGPHRRGESLLTGSLLGLVGVLALLTALKLQLVSRTVLAGFALSSVPLLALTRPLLHAALGKVGRSHRVLVLGDPAEARDFLAAARRRPERGIVVVGRLGAAGGELPVLGREEELEQVLIRHPIDEVYLAGALTDGEQLARTALLCEELGVPLSIDAHFLGFATTALVRDLDGHGLLTFVRGPTAGLELALKRTLDVVGALVGLLAASPLLLLAAVAIKLDDGGPVLFVQERVGRYGRPFPMLKLRTMAPGARAQRAALEAHNEVDGPAFKLRADPRITRVGRWLRRTSVDELPQLLNVLKGEMSLVGPRPAIAEEVARYQRWQLRRLSMRPGLTGLWQVSGRSEIPFEHWMQLDLRYIDTWSFGLDLWLLLRTVPAVLSGRGAM